MYLGVQTAPAHTRGGPRDPGTPSLGRAAVTATAVCLQAPLGAGAPALALWLLPRAPGSALQPDGPASLRVPWVSPLPPAPAASVFPCSTNVEVARF